jgi:hypothetical protein
MINTEALKNYISLGDSPGFYGYGKWSSEIYIIGIEEAGCYSESLIQQKINRYYELNFGHEGLFDNKLFQGNLTDLCDKNLSNYADFYNGNIKKGGYVPKIATLLKVLEDSNIETFEYVAKYFGSEISNHSLIEILPLPCPTVKDWWYPKWVNLKELDYFVSKKKYREEVIKKRVETIKMKIEKSESRKLVLFLANGKDKIAYWNRISPINLNNYTHKIGSIPYHVDKKIMYVLLPFPGSPSSNGKFNSYEQINIVAKDIKKQFDKI